MRSIPSLYLKYLRVVVLSLSAIILSACETELSQESIRIVGAAPPGDWYIGSPFEYTFGLEGGSGVYQVKYHKTPPVGSGFDTPSVDNFVDMSVEITSGPKKEFTLFGTPLVDDGNGGAEFNRLELEYFIEVTDGNDTSYFRFETALQLNRFDGGDGEVINEDTAQSTFEADRLLQRAEQIAANELSSQTVCKSLREEPIRRSVEINGRPVQYYYWQVELDASVGTDTEIRYRLKTNYQESLGELSRANLEYARPGVDYVEEESVMSFLAGERFCVVRVGVFEDDLVEANERLDIEFFRVEGDPIDIDNVSIELVIRDDDETPFYTPGEFMVNRGESESFVVGRSASSSNPASVLISVDNENSSLDPNYYNFTPSTGVLEFASNDVAVTVGFSSLFYPLVPERAPDPRVKLFTSVDLINDEEEGILFVVNEWATDNLASEVVASHTESIAPIDFDVDSGGVVYTLSETQIAGDSASVISGFYRNSLPYDLGGVVNTLAVAGVNVKPLGIKVGSNGSREQLAVMLQVDGLYSGQHYGGSDFVVQIYDIDSDAIELKSTTQFGSELDDEVIGFDFTENQELVVFGNTRGRMLSGSPGIVPNAGGSDGFIYLLDTSTQASASVKWSRFVGEVQDDDLLGVAVGNRELVVSIAEDDAFRQLEFFSITFGAPESKELLPEATMSLGSVPVSFSQLLLGDNNRDFYLAASSEISLPTSNLNGSGLQSISVIQFEASGGINSDLSIGTNSNDQIKSLAVLPGKDRIATVFESSGVYQGQQSAGNNDVLLSVFSIEGQLEEVQTTQFGTPGNDYAIDIEPVGEDKFLVLWSEDFSSGDGSLTYRVSAFAPDGRKLSPNPR